MIIIMMVGNENDADLSNSLVSLLMKQVSLWLS